MLRKNTKAASLHLLSGATLIREVEMEVVFGTPSKNCSGAGICLIANRFPKGYAIACPHAPASIHLVSSRELVFRFRKRSLSETAVARFFNRRYFQVEESFLLPKHLVRMWRLSAASVNPGQYLLEEYSQEWRLYFPLQPDFQP